MQKFFNFIKSLRFPKKSQLQIGWNALSPKELWVVVTSIIVAFIFLILILGKINSYFLVPIPGDGGSIKEGIIGMPTLVNPVLAISDADKDLTALVYSGLMRKMPDGNFVPDLAESYEISPDGTRYTFILKDNIVFHDGKPVTAEDVIFTINKIKDPLVKSPRKANWEGVNVEKKDDKTIIFVLKQPYVSFLDNTNLGILPKHFWEDETAAEFNLSSKNIKAIGSGPYMITDVKRNSEDIPDLYELKRFNKFALGKPHIKSIEMISFANEKEIIQALRSKKIDQAGGISPAYAKELRSRDATIKTNVLPRMFALFFNSDQNKNLAELAVRSAIDTAVDREAIINEVLYGYGLDITGPIPKSMEGDLNLSSADIQTNNIEKATEILTKAGWVKGEDGIFQKGGTKTITQGSGKNAKKVTVASGTPTRLSISITTGDAPELKQAVEKIKENLQTLGIEVNIKIYETGPLNQLIRARDYEVLFFGQIVNHESDLFAFWHSSQKIDPGLNIALYANTAVDALLESSQKTLTKEERVKKYAQFTSLFSKDIPAVFVYSPYYIYAMSPLVYTQSESTVTSPSDRFAVVHEWYIDADMVWKFFVK